MPNSQDKWPGDFREWEYRAIAESARDAAKKIMKSGNRITKDTLIVYADKQARVARDPFERALREQGAQIPKSRYFINYSWRDEPFKRSFTKTKQLEEAVSKRFKELRGKKRFRNVVIVDFYTAAGGSLAKLKKAFESVTRKPVATLTVTAEHKLLFNPDFIGSSRMIPPKPGNSYYPIQDLPPEKFSRTVRKKARELLIDRKITHDPLPLKVVGYRQGAERYRGYLAGIDRAFSTIPEPKVGFISKIVQKRKKGPRHP